MLICDAQADLRFQTEHNAELQYCCSDEPSHGVMYSALAIILTVPPVNSSKKREHMS